MNTTSPEKLAHEAELSRARLDLAIDELQTRLTPLGCLDEAVGIVRRQSTAPLVDTLVGTVRSHPVPTLLFAAGVGFCVLGWRARRREANSNGLHSIKGEAR